MATTPNTVEGGNELLNQALVVTQQIALLLPAIGPLVAAGTALAGAIMSMKGAPAATVEQARAAIADYQRAIQDAQKVNEDWLATHPRVEEG